MKKRILSLLLVLVMLLSMLPTVALAAEDEAPHGSCGENSRRDNKNAVAQPPSAVRLDEKFLMVGLELFERRFCVDFRRVRLRLQILLERRQSRITVFANVVHQPEQFVNLFRILHCRHSFP